MIMFLQVLEFLAHLVVGCHSIFGMTNSLYDELLFKLINHCWTSGASKCNQLVAFIS